MWLNLTKHKFYFTIFQLFFQIPHLGLALRASTGTVTLMLALRGDKFDVVLRRDLRADLSLSIIPEREHSFVMDVNDRKRARDLSKPNIEIISLPESMRDSEPVQIQPAADPGTGNAFSKEEMLKLID